MVEMIGLATVGALIWLLASTMAAESEAESRKFSMSIGHSVSGGETAGGAGTRQAA